ncbi:hypothetical protein [Shewanella acanthi]|uniref:hypothetical protein n=1 Tax=Shewanella acanthi TaxID=2864212 RepID=UPI001C65AD3B|nr:hypothetical protein [Shewanella acanthi]QYJ78821.1 hypothetical protein K0H61_17420 [Shewanella acanthi]
MSEVFSRLLRVMPLPLDARETERGCYRYYLNYDLQPISEPWIKAQTSDGHMIVHSARFVDALNCAILVSYKTDMCKTAADNPAVYQTDADRQASSPSGSFLSQIHWQQAGQDISAIYQFDANERQLTIERLQNGKTQTHQAQRSDNFLYFPLMRVFSGEVITHLASHGPQSTLVPDINHPSSVDALLRPTESLRSAEKLDAEILPLADIHCQTHKYRYLSERYQQQDDAAFWIDETGLLVKYCWQQNPEAFWMVELVEHIVSAQT